MPQFADRFLHHRTQLSRKASLGRVFNVTRESWRLDDDPSVTPPRAELMVSDHTASEAADLARELAEAYSRHGFHKPSSSWWGADATHFHRFVVHAGPRRRNAATVVMVSGLLGIATLLVTRRRGPSSHVPKAARRRQP